MLMAVRFGNNEWNKDIPTINDSEPKYAHAITALPILISRIMANLL
jgi:hypothetical protein